MKGNHDGRWPTFLVIGAARCGTSTLYWLLNGHPEVCVPAVKEVNYFAIRAMGLDLDALTGAARQAWGPAVGDADAYRALFASTDKNPRKLAFGECSPVYLVVDGVAELIRATMPTVRLVAILRDPIDRAVSNHAHNVRVGMEPLTDFADALEADLKRGMHGDYANVGLYAQQLKPYFRCFDRDQILLLDFQELANDPGSVPRRLFEFIGVKTEIPKVFPENWMKTQLAEIRDDTRGFLVDYFRADTTALVEEIGFEPARSWSSYQCQPAQARDRSE